MKIDFNDENIDTIQNLIQDAISYVILYQALNSVYGLNNEQDKQLSKLKQNLIAAAINLV